MIRPSTLKGFVLKKCYFSSYARRDNTKYFIISLIVQQLYREILSVDDEYGGKLPNRVMMFLDEIGTDIIEGPRQ